MSKPITFEREPIISYDENPSIDWESMYNDLHIKLAEKDALLREVYDHVHCDSEIYTKIRKNLEVSDKYQYPDDYFDGDETNELDGGE